MKRNLLLLLIFIFSTSVFTFAAKIDSVSIYSPSMKKEIKAIVITPDSYDNVKPFPVLYLLHGYGGNFRTWTKNMPSVIPLADVHQMVIVMPDGNVNSWYLDSPVNSEIKYETFVSKELITWIDSRYKTIASREGRAISGLSMGGHGGLYVGFRHQDVFGACGSMSGGVDIRPYPEKWDIKNLLGEQKTNKENWENYTVINQLHLLTPNSIKIIIDCGTEDFFYPNNLKLHEQLVYLNIPHDFISRPGKHVKEYWNNAVKFQALYFSNFFEEYRAKM